MPMENDNGLAGNVVVTAEQATKINDTDGRLPENRQSGVVLDAGTGSERGEQGDETAVAVAVAVEENGSNLVGELPPRSSSARVPFPKATSSMARNSNSDDAYSSEEGEEQVKGQEEEDEEELEAVARSSGSDDDEIATINASPVSDTEAAPVEDDYEDEEDEEKAEISKREKARLKEMQKMKKQKIQEMLDSQNASIDADMNNKGKGRIKYLLQQTELFAHFAKSDPSSSQKKTKGRATDIIVNEPGKLKLVFEPRIYSNKFMKLAGDPSLKLQGYGEMCIL